MHISSVLTTIRIMTSGNFITGAMHAGEELNIFLARWPVLKASSASNTLVATALVSFDWVIVDSLGVS